MLAQYIEATAARQASTAALLQGDLDLARKLCRHAQDVLQRNLRHSVEQIEHLEYVTAASLDEGSEARFDFALLQILNEFGYIDYSKSIVAASEAHRRNDPAVALLFYRYARDFLKSALNEGLGRLERLSARIESTYGASVSSVGAEDGAGGSR